MNDIHALNHFFMEEICLLNRSIQAVAHRPPGPRGRRGGGGHNVFARIPYPSLKVDFACALHFWSHMGGGGGELRV